MKNWIENHLILVAIVGALFICGSWGLAAYRHANIWMGVAGVWMGAWFQETCLKHYYRRAWYQSFTKNLELAGRNLHLAFGKRRDSDDY
jgi:hypothetical protein